MMIDDGMVDLYGGAWRAWAREASRGLTAEGLGWWGMLVQLAAAAELRMFEADGRVLWWRVREARAKEALARCLGEFLATVAERFGQGVGRWDGAQERMLVEIRAGRGQLTRAVDNGGVVEEVVEADLIQALNMMRWAEARGQVALMGCGVALWLQFHRHWGGDLRRGVRRSEV